MTVLDTVAATPGIVLGMGVWLLSLRQRVFYGWWMVAAGVLANVLAGGFVVYGFGAFFIPLVDHLGVSRGPLASAVSVAVFSGYVLGPFLGHVVDTRGPRALILAGGFATGLGFVLLSQVSSLWQYYLVFVPLVGIGSSAAFGPAVTASVAKWFRRRRSTALSFVFAGFGLGSIVTPLVTWLIGLHGWQTAAVVLGITVWACTVPIALVIRRGPEHYGRHPDGDAAEVAAPGGRPPVESSPRETLRSRAFWLFALFSVAHSTLTFSVSVHLIPALRDIGLSANVAGSIVGVIGVVAIAGRIVQAWLADLTDRRVMVALSAAFMGAGVIVLALASSLWQVMVFLVLYASAQGGMSILYALLGDYFGTKSFGATAGFLNVALAVGVVIGPTLTGFLFDMTGSYQVPYLLVGALRLASVGLVFMAAMPQQPASQRTA